MTDLEQFVNDTLAFVKRAVPDASIARRTSAATEIVKEFKWLFDKEGNRPTVYRAMMSEWNRKTARHVKDARLKLLLSQVGAVSVDAATDEQVAMLIQRIEARRGK